MNIAAKDLAESYKKGTVSKISICHVKIRIPIRDKGAAWMSLELLLLLLYMLDIKYSQFSFWMIHLFKVCLK